MKWFFIFIAGVFVFNIQADMLCSPCSSAPDIPTPLPRGGLKKIIDTNRDLTRIEKGERIKRVCEAVVREECCCTF